MDAGHLAEDDEGDAVEVQDSDMEDTNSMDGEGPTEPDFDVGLDGTVRNPESFLGQTVKTEPEQD